jgi:hypothetical protein
VLHGDWPDEAGRVRLLPARPISLSPGESLRAIGASQKRIGASGESVKAIKRIDAPPSEFPLFWIAVLAFGTLVWLFLG